MEESRDNRGLVLGTIVCVLAAFGFLITLMPRSNPHEWGAYIAVGLLGPAGGIILAVLAGVALMRATLKPAAIIAWVGLALSVAVIISALALWSD